MANCGLGDVDAQYVGVEPVRALAAAPADALRFRRLVVVEGDYKIDVRYKCGKPVDIESHTIYKTIYVQHKYHPYSVMVSTHVEEWLYNFGPHRLMRWLRFENGQLK